MQKRRMCALRAEFETMSTDEHRTKQPDDLTDRLIRGDRAIDTINHFCDCPLPSRDAVIRIAEDLKEVLFPGYHRRQNLNQENVADYVEDLIGGLSDRLAHQIADALRHDSQTKLGIVGGAEPETDFDAVGRF